MRMHCFFCKGEEVFWGHEMVSSFFTDCNQCLCLCVKFNWTTAWGKHFSRCGILTQNVFESLAKMLWRNISGDKTWLELCVERQMKLKNTMAMLAPNFSWKTFVHWGQDVEAAHFTKLLMEIFDKTLSHVFLDQCILVGGNFASFWKRLTCSSKMFCDWWLSMLPNERGQNPQTPVSHQG